jgi:DNA-binding CsgD family transcriptional regulator
MASPLSGDYTSVMATRPTNDTFDELLGALYQSTLDATPWEGFMACLLHAMDAMVISLTLRPPKPGDTGLILNHLRPYTTRGGLTFSKADPRDWPSAVYREQFFALDPFVNLEPFTVHSLHELMPAAELRESEYYRQFLEPAGVLHILGVDAREPAGMEARLRVSRGHDDAPFTPADKRLLTRLSPHLGRALEISARLARSESERELYAGAVGQLAVGSIILDGRGRVLSTNQVAADLLARGDGIRLAGYELRFDDAQTGRQLQQVVAKVLDAHLRRAPAVVEALRVRRASGKPDLGLVVRPVPRSAWSEDQSSPTVAVFVSAPEVETPTSELLVRQLFEFTPAETRLALRLAGGLSLGEACEDLGISPHTGRAHLKTIFAKSGVTRQAELVRLILRGVATLA